MRLIQVIFAVLAISVHITGLALSDLDYLPKSVSYDPAIPKPADILGAPVGEWHVRHDQLVAYMQALANASERVSLVETGRTHGNRPLLLLAITSKQNQGNLQTIQAQHMGHIANNTQPPADAPLVLWMGYSVHGDEASGTNASMLVAYYLAAGQGSEIDALLDNSVVLLDPAVNPDGIARFAHWANMHRGTTLNADPNHREHQQGWPRGRVNYYWFDLNRDWLLLTHPESRARIKQYHQWRPHVLTDFHEMGPNSTYFFQPGIPSRKNPWTTQKNVEMTESLAKFHAKALDANKQLYFSEEAFDDFYYGKGSTYPDAHGGVGILFEQASSRGHIQDTINGPLTFPDTIQNQVTTSLSTFAGALANKQALLDMYSELSQETRQLIKDNDTRGYVLTESADPTRFAELKAILDQHQIGYSYLDKSLEVDGLTYQPGDSIFVATDQPQYRLIQSLFSTRKRFEDNTFYDVSNWNLPLAFNVQYAAVEKSVFRRISLSDTATKPAATQLPALDSAAYAYGFSWQDYNAPKLLSSLLAADVKAKIAESAFSANTTKGLINFPAGSVLVPTALKQPDELMTILQQHAAPLNIKVWSITSGLTPQGIDLGSSDMLLIKQPKVMLVGGKGTSQYEAGEAWHYLDKHVGMPLSIVDLDELDDISLTSYTHMIWVAGRYSGVEKSTVDKLEAWVKAGGVLIGQTSATQWFSEKDLLKVSFMKQTEIDEAFDSKNLTFGDKEDFAAKQRIAGAAFATTLDITHPLGYGFNRTLLPVFRTTEAVMLKPTKPFVTVAKYTDKPLMAGYTSDELEDLISDSAAVVAHKLGQGVVIGMTDDVNFRGYWYGTSRLLSNAIFMSGFIDAQG